MRNSDHGILGPGDDGGYYLLDLKSDDPSPFRSNTPSYGKKFGKTLNILKFQTFSYLSHNAYPDVDTLEDFSRVKHLEPLKNLGIR